MTRKQAATIASCANLATADRHEMTQKAREGAWRRYLRLADEEAFPRVLTDRERHERAEAIRRGELIRIRASAAGKAALKKAQAAKAVKGGDATTAKKITALQSMVQRTAVEAAIGQVMEIARAAAEEAIAEIGLDELVRQAIEARLSVEGSPANSSDGRRRAIRGRTVALSSMLEDSPREAGDTQPTKLMANGRLFFSDRL